MLCTKGEKIQEGPKPTGATATLADLPTKRKKTAYSGLFFENVSGKREEVLLCPKIT